MCMVTGEAVDVDEITAAHIYRQGWPIGLLVSITALSDNIQQLAGSADRCYHVLRFVSHQNAWQRDG